jgi:hypothetical protein
MTAACFASAARTGTVAGSVPDRTNGPGPGGPARTRARTGWATWASVAYHAVPAQGRTVASRLNRGGARARACCQASQRWWGVAGAGHLPRNPPRRGGRGGGPLLATADGALRLAPGRCHREFTNAHPIQVAQSRRGCRARLITRNKSPSTPYARVRETLGPF